MGRKSEGARDIRQSVIQQLESLQRAGVMHLPKRTAKRPSQTTSPAASTTSRQESADQAVPRSELAGHTSLPGPIAAPPVTKSKESGRETQPTSKSAKTATKNESTGDDRSTALAAMAIEVAACRRCEHLACTRTQTVFGVGNPRPRLCFMGEAPGADEDRRGEPFVGRAGQLLTDIIEKGMQLKRSDVYILNVLKCRPPENRTPTDDEIANCREYFERQLEILQPEFICLLGATAVKAVLNTKQAMGRLRGQWFTYGNARVMVTYHPSYLLRNPPAKKDTWEDIQMLMKEMGMEGKGTMTKAQ